MYAIAFILSIVGILSIPQNEWRVLGAGGATLLLFGLVTSFCGVLLAYFVYVDGKELASLRATIHSIYNRGREQDEELVPPHAEDVDYMRLVKRYKNKGFINPHLRAEHEINNKISLGKTREEAISELLSEDTTTKDTE